MWLFISIDALLPQIKFPPQNHCHVFLCIWCYSIVKSYVPSSVDGNYSDETNVIYFMSWSPGVVPGRELQNRKGVAKMLYHHHLGARSIYQNAVAPAENVTTYLRNAKFCVQELVHSHLPPASFYDLSCLGKVFWRSGWVADTRLDPHAHSGATRQRSIRSARGARRSPSTSGSSSWKI